MARQRALIHVAGPKASGKTTFVEHVLRTVHALIICVRTERDDLLRRPVASKPRTHAELQRYRRGGASGAALYRFPPTDAAADAFFMTKVMEDFSTAVVIEGDRPVDFVDLTAFIAPPPPPGASLLRRVSGDRAADAVPAFARSHPTLLDDAGAAALAAFEQSRRRRPPTSMAHWALAEGYQGLEHAHMVVVNVRDDDERRRADTMLDEVARLRTDDAVFHDVLGWRGNKIPITAVVADLGDPADAGLRKALTRVKRSMRSIEANNPGAWAR